MKTNRVFCLVCLLNEDFPPLIRTSSPNLHRFSPLLLLLLRSFSSVCFLQQQQDKITKVLLLNQREISCSSTKSLLAVFHCNSTNISDVSRLVFRSMNQVGGISCPRCFYFPLLFTVALFFCVCEIFQCSVCLPACGSPTLFLLLSDTDAIVLNSLVPSQQGGKALNL